MGRRESAARHCGTHNEAPRLRKSPRGTRKKAPRPRNSHFGIHNAAPRPRNSHFGIHNGAPRPRNSHFGRRKGKPRLRLGFFRITFHRFAIDNGRYPRSTKQENGSARRLQGFLQRGSSLRFSR